MRAYTVLLLSLMSLFAGCASAPPAPPKVMAVCPRIPDLDWTPKDVLALDFSLRMENFLLGKLPAPTLSAPVLPTAKTGTATPKP
jgi:hypothetical protein